MPPVLQADGVEIDEHSVDFVGYPVDALIDQRRDGQAEAAIMPVYMLEQMASEGLVEHAGLSGLDRRRVAACQRIPGLGRGPRSASDGRRRHRPLGRLRVIGPGCHAVR